MVRIIQDLIPAGRRNRPGRANPRSFITIHNTGNPAKTAHARNHAAYLKSDAANSLPVSWHYTVDCKEIYQHIPDNEIAWHAGDGGGGTGNNQSIGIEICMNEGGDLLKATDNAVKLTAELCKKYNIPSSNVVQHNRWSGKLCPQLIRNGRPYGWDTFIKKVQDALIPPKPAPVPEQDQADKPSGWAEAACDKAVAAGVIQGSGGKFGWREPVTLERMLVVLDRLEVL
jgi:N-acetylmuramoyl-L-alanine amidase